MRRTISRVFNNCNHSRHAAAFLQSTKMKNLRFAILLLACLGVSALAQTTSNPRLNSIQFRDQSVTPFCPQDMTCIFTDSGGVPKKVRNGVVSDLGGGGGGGTPGGSNGNVQFNSAGSFGGVAGFNFNGTSAITLGVAGTSVGSVGFRNATSGTITVSPVTGALGTVTLSLPARTATIATTTGTLTSGRCAQFDASGNLVQASVTCTAWTPGGVANSIQINSGGGLFDGGANAVLDLTTSTLALGTNSTQSGKLLLRNGTNANTTTIQPGAPSSSLTFTLPATLPTTAGCLEVSSTGVITQNGFACMTGTTVGRPASSGSDQAGASFIVYAGAGTGTGLTGDLQFQMAATGSSGSSVNSLVDRQIITKRKALTNSTDTDLVAITLPTLAGASGFLDYTAYASDGTDVQIRRGVIGFSAINKAGTYTTETSIADESYVASTGTLTCTFNFNNGSNQTTLRTNCTSSLTPTTYYLVYMVRNQSEQAVAIQ